MQRISIHDLSPQGQEFTLTDPAVWNDPIAEFHMDCRVVEPLSVTVLLIPSEQGCLVRGHILGKIAVPCNRCAEDALICLNEHFETFEYLPGIIQDEDNEVSEAPEEDSHISLVDGIPMLDLAALCWEEFSLALPITPLCKPDCKGLCAACGANLNIASCNCARDNADPRLAALRNITLTKSGN